MHVLICSIITGQIHPANSHRSAPAFLGLRIAASAAQLQGWRFYFFSFAFLYLMLTLFAPLIMVSSEEPSLSKEVIPECL